MCDSIKDKKIELLNEENEYLMELMARINEQCNQVMHKGYDAKDAIGNIKYMLCGSME